MDELAAILKNQGPLGAVVVLVLAYFMKVLIPHLLTQIEKIANDFRSETAASRADFRAEMAAERTANAANIERLAQALERRDEKRVTA